jgi:thiol-disulfide isomerase/thioredoxin
MKSFSKNWSAPVTDRRRFIAELAGLGLLLTSPLVWGQGRGMTSMSAVLPAPTLRLKDTDEKLVDLAQYKGRVVLINFWATWCPPCRKEFPSLGRVRKLFKPGEFEVLAVNVGEDPDSVFSFTGITDFPVMFDRDSKAMLAWSVRGLPTTFLVDRQGRLAYRATGGREFDDPDIVATIRQLLKS